MQIIEIMEKTFDSESNDIALYLAMSKKADEEGHFDIAAYLYDVAMEEASHAVQFASLLGKVKDTKTNLVNILAGGMQAEMDKAHAAKVAYAEGNDDASNFLKNQ